MEPNAVLLKEGKKEEKPKIKHALEDGTMAIDDNLDSDKGEASA